MRTLSPALLAEQIADTCTPYVKFNLTSTVMLYELTGLTNTGYATHLANGANTITVDQLGTFTINVPVGVTGTVASGTCTVANSPVALAAGLNTITTTTALGTITVTIATVSYDYTTRVLSLEHHEEPYDDYATVVLDNSDLGIVTNLKGYWVQIAYGYITGNAVADSEGADSAGNNATAEYSYTPRLWVKSQEELSSPGNQKTILQLEGLWSNLREADFQTVNETNDTLYYAKYTGVTTLSVLNTLAKHAGYTIDAIGTQSDGIIDVDNIAFEVNGSARLAGSLFSGFDRIATLFYRLINITKCYLRSKTQLAFKVMYPQTSDSVVKTFYSDMQPIFTEYLERRKLLIPNRILVQWDGTGEEDWRLWACWTTPPTLGEALDQGEIDAYKKITSMETAGELTTQAKANARAAALLTRRKAELLSGHLVVRHDCSLELYDRIAIEDNRGI